MNYVSRAVKAIILIYIVLFVVYNSEKTEITLIPKYFVTPEIPLWIPILGALFAGGLVAALGFLIERMRLKKDLKNTLKDLTHAEEELQRLRNLPLLKDSDNSKKDS